MNWLKPRQPIDLLCLHFLLLVKMVTPLLSTFKRYMLMCGKGYKTTMQGIKWQLICVEDLLNLKSDLVMVPPRGTYQ